MVNETAKGIDGTLRVFEAFAGYGSQRMALNNLGVKHEVVATSEVDEYAILSYAAIHGSDLDKELPESEEVIKEYLAKLNVPLTDKGKLKNLRGKRLRQFYNALEQSNGLGDISKIDVNDIPDHDLFTYSFPCQDISVAGKEKGFSKGSGTRSGLLWECERIISAKKPKYLLMENVKNLISKKFMPGFQEWIDYLESIGYTNYWEVLNAKDFGIPQNRERVFMVSILGEHEPYVFPKPIKLEKRLKDVLEDEVDEKYYLDDERAKQLVATITDVKDVKQQEGLKMNRNEVSGKSDIAQTLLARDYKGFGNQDMNGVIEPERVLGIFDKENSTHQSGSVYNKEKIAPTLDTMQGGWRQPSIIDEPKIAASRGRNPENPSDRTKGAPTEQRLEVNEHGTSNTLTTVAKDNYVIEPNNDDVKPINPLKGKTNNGWHFEQEVYDDKGIARALKAGGGSGNIPKTIERQPLGTPTIEASDGAEKIVCEQRTDEGLRFFKDDVCGTIRTIDAGGDKRVLEPKIAQKVGDRGTSNYSVKDISNTIPANPMSDRGQLLLEPKEEFGRMGRQAVETYNEKQPNYGDTVNPFNKTVDNSNNCPTVTTRPEGFKTAILPVTQDYRIRKLTPKECWRLMDVTDEDFYKAQAVNSNSQLYKQAGNSIVVAVLEAIFRNMFLEVPDEDLIGEQIALFEE